LQDYNSDFANIDAAALPIVGEGRGLHSAFIPASWIGANDAFGGFVVDQAAANCAMCAVASSISLISQIKAVRG